MKKIKHFLLTTLVLLGSALTSWAESAPYSGTPSATIYRITASNYTNYGFTAENWQAFQNYYAIASAEDLYKFAAMVNGGSNSSNAVLTDDIVVNLNVPADGNLNGATMHSWTPIGTYSTPNRPYKGTFDGNGHTISGLYFENTTDGNYPDGGSYVGLIGYASGAMIKNVGVVDSYIKGSGYVGGICSRGYNTTITNCYNTGTVSGTDGNVGGICGYLGTQTNCYNTGKVSGSFGVGGICGTDGTQTNCYYLAGSCLNSGGGVSVTAEEFASGKITFLLNGSTSGDNNAWRQNLNNGNDFDAHPVLDKTHAVVYASQPCTSVISNTESAVDNPHTTTDATGRCTACGQFIVQGTLVTESNYSSLNLTADFVGYYAIENAAQLYWFADFVNNGDEEAQSANAVLTANIVVNESVLNESGNLNGTPTYSWTPIGTNSKRYAGTFDGHGHTISGLYFNNTTDDNYPSGGKYVGLIGYANGATIKNVGVIDSYLNGYCDVGGICGYSYFESNTPITNCYNTGTVSGSGSVGGICGEGSTTITNCYNTGMVSISGTYVGGICGYAVYSSITNCYNTGAVSGWAYYAGGICGQYGTVSNCYNTGTVSGSGICGRDGTQTNCYNAGTVSGGGICGQYGTQTNCYYLADCGSKNTLGVSATAEEFSNGKVTYLLNGSTSEGDLAWYQTLGVGNDVFPVLDNNHHKVYATQPCATGFSNTEGAVNPHSSVDEITGYCSACGKYITTATLTDGVYQIGNAAQLYWFADFVNNGHHTANAVLIDDIVVNLNVPADGNLNGATMHSWTPIGTSAYKYAGTFDGNGHTISGLYFNNTTDGNYPYGGNYVGLIGYANGTTIKNVGIIDSYIRGRSSVGGICGIALGTTITNCYNTGTVSSSGSVGGICGYIDYSSNTTITNCHNTGTVSGSGSVGGICGYVYSNGNQTNCYNTGTVSGSSNNVGGICGYVRSNGAQTNCYNTGTVSGSSYVGGICGRNGNQTNCYYLAGCAKDGNNVVQYGVGNATTGQTTADVAGRTTAVTAEEFGSGKITYLLNGSTSGVDNAWRQNLDNGDDVDAYPVLDNHAVVYAKQPCTSEFSNTEGVVKEHPSMDALGRCTACGQPTAQGTLVDENNYSSLNLSADFVGYYAISNSGELYWFADLVNNGDEEAQSANAVLTADIVVNAHMLNEDGTLNGTPTYSWTPIGTKDKPFAGTFDGNGHTIGGLYFNNTNYYEYPDGGKYVGLIGHANGAAIKNVGVVKSYLNGYEYVGGICGYGEGSTITNCHNTGTVSGSSDVGGICGYGYNSNSNTTITNCYNTGTVSGSSDVGGICGYGYSTTITNCFNTGTVSGSSYVGGICGEDGTQSNCYNTGTVSGSSYAVGGICGYSGTQTNCYYLEGCAKDGNNTVQNGMGNYMMGSTTADYDGRIKTTAAEFASGKITYLLNGSTSEGDLAWRQTLGDGNDAYPVLDKTHNVVYAKQPCPSDYSNTSDAVNSHSSMDAIGCCTACGQFIAQGTLVTESNCGSLNLTADFVGYYAISKSADLYWFANEVNNGNNTINAVLTADIEVNKNVLSDDGTLNGTPTYSWTPIGTSSKPFAGTFDGNNHTISGLYFNNTTNSDYPDGGKYVGLIGYANGATIKNVGVIGSYIRGYSSVGGICGYSSTTNTTITNCYNTGKVSGDDNAVGGICGVGSNTTITNCYNTGTVSCFQYVGGICGYDYPSSITNCYNMGTVSGSSYVGSICGVSGTQTNCYYLAGCAKDGSNTVQNGVGCTQGSTVADNDGTIKTAAAEFASGKITYLLNGGTSGNNNAWRQNLGVGGDADAYPVLDKTHAVVYVSQPCTSVFSNSDNVGETQHSTADATGRCTACGQFLVQATLVTESNYGSLNLTADFIGYYAISNSGELYWFANEVKIGNNTINAVLTADIEVNKNVLNDDGTLNGTPTYSWKPIGTESNNFKGTFDGNSHTISGLYYPDGGDYVGLIGYANGAKIKNVGVVDSYISGSYYVGGICGFTYSYSNSTTITNCYNTGTVSGSGYVGGICGYGYNGIQTNCYNTGTVSGSSSYVGGICGFGVRQTNCYNTGTVSGSSDYVGGICGDYGIQANCYYLESCGSKNSLGVSATAEEFASGKIGYLLNQNNNNAWYQDLYSDEYPLLDNTHNLVSGYIDVVDDTYTVVGNVYLATNYEVAEGKTLSVPAGASLTTGEAVITNNGTIIVNGNSTISGNDLEGSGSFLFNDLLAETEFVLNTTSYTYKGTAFTLEDGIDYTLGRTYCGKLFLFNGSYTASYSNNLNTGTATVTITNSADAENVVSKEFTISAKEVELVWENTSLTYNGSAQKPTATATGMVNNESLAVSVSGEQTNAGTYTATTSISDNNYKLPDEVTKEFAISKAMPTYTAPENLAVKCNETLSDITLPSGFAFENESAELAIGENTLTVKFTPEDTANYKVVEGIEVKAVKAAHTVITDAAVAATCTESGLTEGSHCSVCHTVLVAQEVIPADHTAGAAVAENLKAATCTVAGSVDSVVYCSICKEELSRKTVVIDATGHKADSVVFENIVAATCTTAGSKDSVVYCSVCKAEVSRTKVTLPATGHTVVVDSAVAATATTDGLTEGSHCSVCGETIVAQEVIPATGEQGGEGNGNEGGNENQGGNNQGGNENNGGNENQGGNNEGGNENQGGENTEPATAIADDAAPAVNIYAYQNIIVVENATDEIFVYNVMGGLVARGTETTITVNHTGVYIVKTGTTAKRVMINQ